VEIVREMGLAHGQPSAGVPGITAAALSERLNIPVSAASNRLKHLFDRRLIRREERLRSIGGREYSYWPLWAYRADR
jgi:predicted transcriptional regulator